MWEGLRPCGCCISRATCYLANPRTFPDCLPGCEVGQLRTSESPPSPGEPAGSGASQLRSCLPGCCEGWGLAVPTCLEDGFPRSQEEQLFLDHKISLTQEKRGVRRKVGSRTKVMILNVAQEAKPNPYPAQGLGLGALFCRMAPSRITVLWLIWRAAVHGSKESGTTW